MADSRDDAERPLWKLPLDELVQVYAKRLKEHEATIAAKDAEIAALRAENERLQIAVKRLLRNIKIDRREFYYPFSGAKQKSNQIWVYEDDYFALWEALTPPQEPQV